MKTNEDIYLKLGKVHGDIKSIDKQLASHERRIGKNTKFRYYHLGAYVLLGFCVAVWKLLLD